MKKTLLIAIMILSFCYGNAQTVTLSGSGTDADGTISSYSWRKVSGPASGVITNPNSAITTVTGLTVGVYQYELTVTDNQGATGSDTVQVTVLPGNIRPKANAGQDQIITLPTTALRLSGTGTGEITAYNWNRISGPNFPTIVDVNAASTLVTGLKKGNYIFGLTVTNNKETDVDYVNIKVKRRCFLANIFSNI